MATGPVKNALNVYRITDDALPLLREKMEKWFHERECVTDTSSPQWSVKQCFDADTLKKDLDRIFKDKLLDVLEAPKFHELMTAIQKEGIIDRAGVEGLNVERAIDAYFGDGITLLGLEDKELNRKYQEVAFTLMSFSIAGHIRFFTPDDKARTELCEHLRVVALKLRSYQRFGEALFFLERQEEEEGVIGFSNFVGPTNLWGLSVLFADGKAFTSNDVERMVEMTESLSTLWLGARMFELSLAREEGLPLGNRAIQAFLRSPFADFAQLDYFFSGDGKKKPAGEREWQEAVKALAERSGGGYEFRED